MGSFKLRGALNALKAADIETLKKHGVLTSSAGNFAQGVAWGAKELGIDSTIIVPDNAPETKLHAIERLGGRVIKVPYGDWWEVMMTHRYEGVNGHYIHPVVQREVIAGTSLRARSFYIMGEHMFFNPPSRNFVLTINYRGDFFDISLSHYFQ